MTYGQLLEAAALVKADMPVRVRLANGELADVAGAELDIEVEDHGVDEASGEPIRPHRLLGVILRLG
jgi:hypothetical protein